MDATPGQMRPADAEQDQPPVVDVLRAAVAAIGGDERSGQVQMAAAVEAAMKSGQHLLVQAGTGTGKSLAYLVPAILHPGRVVVATATLALQHQLVERDIPALLAGVDGVLSERPSYAVLKGRNNYACLHRVRDGVPDDQGVLVEIAEGSGAEVLRLRAWAEEQATSGGPGDRDSAPSHVDRTWRQVSVSHRECLGAAKCPYGLECFAERAREKAAQSDLIVTNHSLLAIDTVGGVPMIPEYDVVVVDEAHELVSRVTQQATDELSLPVVDRAVRRVRNFVKGREADDLDDAADALRGALVGLPGGRIVNVPEALSQALALVRDAARAVVSALPRDTGEGDGDAARQQARGIADEVRKVAERLAAHSDDDVTWLAERELNQGSAVLCIAPLRVDGQLRGTLFADKTAVLTSATIKLGGDFTALAVSVGLHAAERVDHSLDLVDEGVDYPATAGAGAVSYDADDPGDEQPALSWRGVDVGSPFDYRHQAILYVARHLPPPSRDGIPTAQIDEIVSLVSAAGGRTLGLFSSRRAAEAASEAVREALPHIPLLCQGDGQLSHLQAEFVANPAVCLFGTLSLWQGVDVPGPTCQLVLIDRIPFPRPDDPLMSARSNAVSRAGGNGFMAVAATHAALLLAQGAGRLVRTTTDRGVVAVLDSRLATARYAGFLRASLPPMWTTYDPQITRDALTRLSGMAAQAS